ncbi:hypothetical protein AF335_08575 [Streptomyces eurocidicus]|uniref:Uncharacterized protein n=1 Tax=Streptomyces eurocidicus TaxID=66423 RepID=A0A2N8P0P2_STREU|nr:hypothetical protein [Streptomyces eurocidicus]MBB5122082.1 hypothetical protein [Streptomyces eurocidicus]MBF6055415.1 hypothetical protein [Streptomyces eurocidicus]PNE34595.1 hypothetical protein AF335_08575 [Streptomyces eurocidicus]
MTSVSPDRRATPVTQADVTRAGGSSTAPLTPIAEQASPQILNIVTGLLSSLLGGLSDRNAKTDVTPVRWDR